jgi:hypothetical protein
LFQTRLEHFRNGVRIKFLLKVTKLKNEGKNTA